MKSFKDLIIKLILDSDECPKCLGSGIVSYCGEPWACEHCEGQGRIVKEGRHGV